MNDDPPVSYADVRNLFEYLDHIGATGYRGSKQLLAIRCLEDKIESSLEDLDSCYGRGG